MKSSDLIYRLTKENHNIVRQFRDKHKIHNKNLALNLLLDDYGDYITWKDAFSHAIGFIRSVISTIPSVDLLTIDKKLKELESRQKKKGIKSKGTISF